MLVSTLAFAIRHYRKAPAWAAMLVVTLALGIGATTGLFAVVDAALLRPLPFPEPDRLVAIPNARITLEGSTNRPRLDIRRLRELDVFQSVGAYATGGLNLSASNNNKRVFVALVTPSVFRMLGVPPVRGRWFVDDEEALGAAPVAMISHALWSTLLGSDERVVKSSIELNGISYQVVGIMPAGFAFPSGADVWIPMTVPLARSRTEIFRVVLATTGIARLSRGTTPQAANVRIATVLAPPRDSVNGRPVIPDFTQDLRTYYEGNVQVRVWLMAAAAALLLLLACANVAGLLTARSFARQRELAVRHALGADRTRILVQLLLEALVLAVAGTIVGAVIAMGAVSVMKGLAPPDLLAVSRPQVDLRVLVAATAVTVLAALLSGTLPAIALRGDAAQLLRASGPGAALGRTIRRAIFAVVAVEVGLSATLLIASGVLLTSLSRVLRVDTGLRLDGVVTAQLALPRNQYESVEAKRAFFAGLVDDIRAGPGIDAAAVVQFLPLGQEPTPVLVATLKGRDSSVNLPVEHVRVTGGYFRAMGIELVTGRTFQTSDIGSHVAVASASFAAAYPGASLVDAFVVPSGDTVPRRIVGIVSDVKSTALDGRTHPQLYLPLEDEPYPQAALVVRGSGQPADLYRRMQDAAYRRDPRQVLFGMSRMVDVARASVMARRTATVIVVGFGSVALVLAAIGLYGLIAFTTAQRMPELGICAALGAPPGRVARIVVREAVAASLAGLVLGLILAAASARVLRSILFGTAPLEPVVVGTVAVLLVLTSVVAAMPSARKAATVDPLRVMRAD
jgi:predicted permease